MPEFYSCILLFQPIKIFKCCLSAKLWIIYPFAFGHFYKCHLAAVCNEASHLAVPSLVWNNTAPLLWTLLIQRWISHEIKMWITAGLFASLPPFLFRILNGIKFLIKILCLYKHMHCFSIFHYPLVKQDWVYIYLKLYKRQPWPKMKCDKRYL